MLQYIELLEKQLNDSKPQTSTASPAADLMFDDQKDENFEERNRYVGQLSMIIEGDDTLDLEDEDY